MTATIYGHPHIVEMLLEAGANTNDKNLVSALSSLLFFTNLFCCVSLLVLVVVA